MTLSATDDVLWAVLFALHLALFSVLLGKGRARRFPLFTGFVGFETFQMAVLFVSYRAGLDHLYRRLYWYGEIPELLLQIGVVFEIARNVLRPTGTWVSDARRTFVGIGSVGILAAVCLALLASPAAPSSVWSWLIKGNLFAIMLTLVLSLAVEIAAHRFGLVWRNHVMGLVQGWTGWALVTFIVEAVHSYKGLSRDYQALVHVRMYGSMVALGYWIVTFWLPEPERKPLSPEMQNYLIALHNRVHYDLASAGGSDV